MALKDSRGGREYDKFVADGSGDTAMRVSATSSATTSATSTAGDTGTPVVLTTGVGTEMLAATDVEGKGRIGIQVFNIDNASNFVFKVWGSLVTTPGTPPVVAAGTNWTQIGDDIEVPTGTFNAYKAISTTPLKSIAVTCVRTGGADTNKGAVFILAD